jgi:translation initiation factor eIF-2B subunit gamma
MVTKFARSLCYPLQTSRCWNMCYHGWSSRASKAFMHHMPRLPPFTSIIDVLIICPESHHSTLYHHVNSEVSTSLRIDIHGFEESQDAGAGTCTLLRHFSSRITKDFILLPCDFIPPVSFALQRILDKFRVDVTSGGAALTTCWIPSYGPEKNLHPQEWGTQSASSILYDEQTETLLYIDNALDVDSNTGDFEFKLSLLSR